MAGKTSAAKTPEKPGAGKTIVLTLYGKGDAVTDMSVNLFGAGALNYCLNTNALRLKGGKWVHAAIIGESEKIALQKPPTAGHDIGVFKQLDDRSVQKTLLKTDAQTLTLALKTADGETKERVFRNMDETHARILKEDIEYIGKVKRADVLAAQNKIAGVIDRLALTGEIEFLGGDYV
jgi:hypothetical protein